MKFLLTLLLFIISFSANADVHKQLLNCSKISADKTRLACFDRLVITKARAATPAEIKAPEPKTSVQTIATKTITPQPASPAAKQPATKKYIELTEEQAFGKSAAEINQMESIKTSIVGEFKGWKKGALLTLANGQKWRVKSRSKGYVKLINPEVVISRGFLGSYNMKVEGLNASAKVRREK